MTALLITLTPTSGPLAIRDGISHPAGHFLATVTRGDHVITRRVIRRDRQSRRAAEHLALDAGWDGRGARPALDVAYGPVRERRAS